MPRPSRDLAVIVTVALLAAGLALAGVLPRADGLGLVLVVPLVIACPGLAMLAALGVERLDTLTRATAVLAVGLAWTVLLGLLLHATPFGLGGASFAAALAALVVGWAAIAVRRRRHAALEPPPSRAQPGAAARPRTSVIPRVLFAAAGCLAAAALAIGVWGARNVGQPAFTQLWATPDFEHSAIHVGVQNLEGRPMTYELRLQIGDESPLPWHALSMAPEETWEGTVVPPWPPIVPGWVGRPLVVELVRSDRPTDVYRLVRIWPRPAIYIPF